MLVPSTSSSSSSFLFWDDVARSLFENEGVATVDLTRLPPHNGVPVPEVLSRVFVAARRGMDRCHELSSSSSLSDEVPWIHAGTTTAHATGFHLAGRDETTTNGRAKGAAGLGSRYNEHREGFVFSDGECFDVDLGDGDDGNDFRAIMEAGHDCLHSFVATEVLRAVARRCDPEGDDDWFETTLGPTDDVGQWHVKRYVTPGWFDGGNSDDDDDDLAAVETLPSHTDPSLVSVVVHDVPGRHKGGLGLQRCRSSSPPKSRWEDVPCHGHDVATVFTGSVLSLLTGGTWLAARHRVVRTKTATDRAAATLFVRPRGDAILRPPPSLLLKATTSSSKHEAAIRKLVRRNLTFEAWNARVARNYAKRRERNATVEENDK